MINLPEEILAYTGAVGRAVRPGNAGNADIWLLEADHGRFILKLGSSPNRLAEAEAEYRVITALQAQVPLVPRAFAQVRADDTAYFLYSCLDGADLVEVIRGAPASERHPAIAEFGRALRMLHSWAPSLPRPTDWLTDALARAEANLSPEPIDAKGPFQGALPRDLLGALKRWRPTVTNQIAFGHGDYCLPNVMLSGGRLSGIIDLSRGAYMDRRIDLAAGIWTIRYNLGEGEGYAETFLDAYGYHEPLETLHWFEALWHLLP